MWALWRNERSFVPARTQTPDSPACSLINRLTTLCWLHPEEGDSMFVSTKLHAASTKKTITLVSSETVTKGLQHHPTNTLQDVGFAENMLHQ
jgi:hypothetical protein